MLKPSLTFIFALLGAGAVAFLGGAAAVHFDIPAMEPLRGAFEAGRDWADKLALQREKAEACDADDYIRQVTVTHAPGHDAGYTLLHFTRCSKAYLLNGEGKILHAWDVPFSKAWAEPPHIFLPVPESLIGIEKAHVFANGDLLLMYTGEQDTPWGYGMVKVDKDSNILWRYGQHTHHDFYVDGRSGHILVLVQDWVKQPPPGLARLKFPVLAGHIVELSADGKELSRLSLLEAFANSPYAPLLSPVSGQSWDVMHSNSLEPLTVEMAKAFPMFKPGQVLVSMRRNSAIAVIDREKKQVAWAYAGQWKGQHAAHFLPDGTILMFDNMGVIADKRSRVIAFDPRSGKITWQYDGGDAPFYSRIYGRAQGLPNGHVLVVPTLDNAAFEVTRDGRKVWELNAPYPVGGALRYTARDVAFAAP